MATVPTPVTYGVAIEIARAELERISDHIEECRPEEDEDSDRFDDMMDIAQSMWSQMTWTLAKAYGVEYEDAEGSLSVRTWDASAMTAAPIAYEDALRIAGAELTRIWDDVESQRPDGLRTAEFNHLMDVAHGMWTQMFWTLAQVYGLEYEDIEAALECYL